MIRSLYIRAIVLALFLSGLSGIGQAQDLAITHATVYSAPDAPARITNRGGSPNSHQTYNASNGGAFAETIIREFFGYQPDLFGRTLVPDSRRRGFAGQLLNLQQGSQRFNVSSTDQGLEVTPVK